MKKTHLIYKDPGQQAASEEETNSESPAQEAGNGEAGNDAAEAEQAGE